MQNKISLFALLILLLPFSASADWSKVAAKDFEMEDYPADGSAEYKADFSELLRLQKNRSEKDCALALKQKIPDFKAFYGESAGLFSGDEFETVQPLLTKVTKLGDRISDYFKHKFTRPRPYDEDKRIQPCADKPGGALAYPSSHTAIAGLDACILAELFPKRAKDILAYGEYLGDLRAIAGVHHPSDVAAGKALAKDLCDYLLGDKGFLADLKEVKNEL
ncbi:MAG: phosphatase PAP2 family protein [Bdellovibrionota bacterium]